MSYYKPVEPRKNKTWIWVLVLLITGVIVFAALACGGMFSGMSQAPQGDAGIPVLVPTTRGVVPSTIHPPTTTEIPEGDWLIGDDARAGTYKTPGTRKGILEFCVWTVYASDDRSSEVVDFGTSSEQNEQGRVKLKDGQLFETSGCQPWVRQ